MPSYEYDAVIVGSGPNGLAAAITLARAGLSVLVVEGQKTPGGGMRTAELTLPGFHHDICSAVHPLALASPFFRSLDLKHLGVDWILPPVSLAHPLDDGTAGIVFPSVEDTAFGLGRDGRVWRLLFQHLVSHSDKVVEDLLAPLRFPRHPLLFASYAPLLLSPATWLSNVLFRDERTRAVFAGMAGHSVMPLERPTTGAFGLLLTMLAHSVGWPIAKGGSQTLADGLVNYLGSLGASLTVGWNVQQLEELPSSRVVLFDTSPRGLLKITGHKLPASYKAQLARYRHNPGVFKMDWALSTTIPWKAREVGRSATVHLGGSMAEIASSERDAWNGRHSERPFVLLSQPSLFDPTRAPQGSHTAWAYCHVPHGSAVDRTVTIENQIERFAPGFRDCILARSTHNSVDMEAYNPNYVGGDINGGVQDIIQAYFRPSRSLTPYRTPLKGVYLCSSSTPPGGGVHGMCGWYAAQTVLADLSIT